MRVDRLKSFQQIPIGKIPQITYFTELTSAELQILIVELVPLAFYCGSAFLSLDLFTKYKR